MLLSQFEGRFPTEESCVSCFRDIRISQGVSCPDCGNKTDKWVQGRKVFQCTKCGCHIPLTKGRVTGHGKLSLRTWFYAMHLMTSIKQVLSAKEVRRQLRMEQYPPVWLMMMKLRNIMGKRDSICQLSDEVGLDEAFFPIRLPEEAHGGKIKRGAGSQQQARVLVIVESKPVGTVLRLYVSEATGQSIGKAVKFAKKAEGKALEKPPTT